MTEKIHVSSAPHIRCDVTTARIMHDVIIALLPCGVCGVYLFGWRALWVILTSVVTCVLTEYLFQKGMKRPVTVTDGSAIVTGLLLAYCMPASVPLYIPVLGGVFAILVVKQLFGGIGQNIMNPALAARCFLVISFAGRMTAYPFLRTVQPPVDLVSSATPLMDLKAGQAVDLWHMFLGTHSGCLGETSVAAVLIGACYLFFRRVITWHIPVAYIGSTLVFCGVFAAFKGAVPADMTMATYLVAQACGGGLALGAFFMATDYVTCPITNGGRLVYGVLLGFLTAVFRVLGKSAEGVSFAIIIVNLLVPLIEKITMPRAFGKGGRAK